MSRTPILVMALLAAPTAFAGPAPAHEANSSNPWAPAGSSFEDSRQDDAIRRAYRDVLRRSPSDRELRKYRDLMDDRGWSERDVREDLRRDSDSRSSSDSRRPSEGRGEDPDRIVRRAYQDILEREPDTAGLRLYRSRIIDEKWSEEDVRKALRESPEFRDKNAMTPQKAQEVVRRAYRSVLNRDPDPGSRVYVDKVLRERWTEQDVARELRNSDEYRNKRR